MLTVLSSSVVSFCSSFFLLSLYAYINDPRATEVEANIPDMSINANKPPINPPFNLSKFDFKRSINNKKVVALRELILKKVSGVKGLNNI